MLEVENLFVSYRNKRVIRNLSLQVRAGEIVCLLGPNGAGKSSLIRAISGHAAITGGTIRLLEEEIHGLSPVEIVRKGIVQCPEGRQLFGTLTVEENIKLGAERNRDSRAKFAEALKFLSQAFPVISERWRQKAATLSGGEQQMVALARSVVACPKILILDEPSLGLAPIMVKSLFEVLGRISKQGVTILLAEQNVSASLAIATRGYILSVGSIVKEGPTQDLRSYITESSDYAFSSDT